MEDRLSPPPAAPASGADSVGAPTHFLGVLAGYLTGLVPWLAACSLGGAVLVGILGAWIYPWLQLRSFEAMGEPLPFKATPAWIYQGAFGGALLGGGVAFLIACWAWSFYRERIEAMFDRP